ncbi:MAG: DUF1847 domain-containing protein [Desulfobacterales bacterium]
MTHETPNCARCPYEASSRLCRMEGGKAPSSCPTLNQPDLVNQSMEEYANTPVLREFARQAAIQEADGYANRDLGYQQVRPSKSRIEEIMEFAGKMNYRRLGMAFCIGLRKEAKVVEGMFSAAGFEVVSAVCKVGRISKEFIGVGKDQQIDPETTEAMCNPVLQAMVLNREKTEFNVLLGLCVGHDSLFFKYAEAPCTVLAVKDRLLGHNPLAAVYNVDSYYRCLKQPRKP